MFAHVDADLLVYRCGFAAERNWWFLKLKGETMKFKYKAEAMDSLDSRLGKKRTRVEGVDYDLWAEREAEPVSHALRNVRTMTDTIKETLQLDEGCMRLYLSGDTNFRKDIAVSRIYKGNRDATHKPVHGPAIREYMNKNFDCITSKDEEADDLIGYSHYRLYKEDEFSTVIVSNDKDMDMIPGLHFNFVKEEQYVITEDIAMRCFWKQLLMGDTTDNIPGLPKVGAMGAAKLIDSCQEAEIEAVVAREYQSRAPTEHWLQYMTEQAQLLWIRREPGQMWEPSEYMKELAVHEYQAGGHDEPVEINLFD